MDLTQRKARQRFKLKSVTTLPRLSVHKSNKYLYAQVIDMQTGAIVLGMSDQKIKAKENKAGSFGEAFGAALKKKKVEKIAFDRSGYKYHGKIKAFADGVRQAGIKF